MFLFLQPLQLPPRAPAVPCSCSCNHYSCRPCFFSCNHYSCRPMFLFLQPLQLPPHVPVPATITVATPVGWTWDRVYRQTNGRKELQKYFFGLREA
ncbi:hypothetical protein AVEN_65166-1 [Araneus ventricosus]|uniref:Uncharacterized protein n=1 Tax=Araneus ventricosus TaxID=182803 RepID=A0A4Y2AH76_ARAVE|nr:hypothetical protein AVEN_65166-1 [Araneus ventricosus]